MNINVFFMRLKGTGLAAWGKAERVGVFTAEVYSVFLSHNALGKIFGSE